jgi:hypothetical protein
MTMPTTNIVACCECGRGMQIRQAWISMTLPMVVFACGISCREEYEGLGAPSGRTLSN